jgi:hypothetical protein
MNKQELIKLAKLFTSNTLSKVALSTSHDNSLFDAMQLLGLENSSVKTLYDKAYSYLFSNYQNEYIYKNTLAIRHLLGKHSLKTSTMLSEFRVGKNKADCVIINGSSTCYEIKTNQDSLQKLNNQINSYEKVFDYIYVVTGNKHTQEVLKQYPSHIGVIELKNNSYFHYHRKAKLLVDNFDIATMLKSLRKEEYSYLANRLNIDTSNIPNGLLFSYCQENILNKKRAHVRDEFRNTLKKFRSIDSEFISNLPAPLKAAAINYNFSKKEIKSLTKVFA